MINQCLEESHGPPTPRVRGWHTMQSGTPLWLGGHQYFGSKDDYFHLKRLEQSRARQKIEIFFLVHWANHIAQTTHLAAQPTPLDVLYTYPSHNPALFESTSSGPSNESRSSRTPTSCSQSLYNTLSLEAINRAAGGEMRCIWPGAYVRGGI